MLVAPLGPLVTYHSQLSDLEMEIGEEKCDTLTLNGGDPADEDLNHNHPVTMINGDKYTTNSQRAPKKLFDEKASESVPDVTLKDYEDQNLRELARERRRIIENQAVRRKKIECWAFATSVDETNNDNWIESLRQFEEVPSPPTELSEITSEKVNGAMDHTVYKSSAVFAKKIGTVDSASIIENKESLRVFWERRIMAEQERSTTKVPGKSAAAEEQVGDASPPDSLNGDLGDPSSVKEVEIIPAKAVEEPAVEQTDVEKSAAETPAAPESQPPPPEIAAPAEAETPASPPPAPQVMEGGESSVAAVVPPSVQPELIPAPAVVEQKQEEVKEEIVQVSEEPCTETSSPAPIAELVTEVPKSEAVASDDAHVVPDKIETPTEETPTAPPVIEKPIEPVVIEKPKEMEDAIPAPPQEQPAPVEPVPEKVNGHQTAVEDNVANKPQIIGETYHHVTKTQQPSPPKVPLVTLKKTFPSPTERTFKAESKIALEIQEMQKREEELKKMREVVIVETTVKSPSESNHSEGSASVHSDDSLGPSPPQSLSKPVVQNISRTISPESVPNGQAYNIGYAFTRKDNVKVKPLADPPESEIEKVKTPTPKETPIEREIRIAREREEELRKEKGLNADNGHEESLVRPTSLTNGKSRQSLTKPVGDTQRSLATSRIQQEIEEQTEREKSLRASGVIKTISQERTDSRVTGRLGELTNGDGAKTPLSPVSSNGDQPPASPIFNGSTNGTTNGTSSPVNGKINDSLKTPSPSNSTVSSSPVKTSPAGRRFSNPPPGRGVNMQRFISSKGKDVAFKSFNGNGLEKSSSLVALNNEPYELKPPQIPIQNKVNQRRSVTLAGPRIQEELKEMQEREEELKKQRARMLGLSQPNLSTVGTEEDVVTNGHEEKPALERSNSNPNLTENGESDETDHVNDKNVPVGGPRRRSTLIDQWEQRIQKLDVKS